MRLRYIFLDILFLIFSILNMKEYQVDVEKIVCERGGWMIDIVLYLIYDYGEMLFFSVFILFVLRYCIL
ncbi:MAG: hypothetical protein QXT63_04300 [Thermoplasmata archaeon]